MFTPNAKAQFVRLVALSLFASVIVTFAGCNISSQSSAAANSMKTADEAARKVMMSLSQLVTEANYKGLGFKSLEEVKTAQLGTGVKRRVVSYQQLLKYQPGIPFSQLFTNEEQVIYPIQVAETVRTTVSVSKRGDSWQISTLGDPQLASVLPGSGQSQAALQIISIPGLNLEFAGTQQGDDWILIPVQDFPQLKFTKGRAVGTKVALPTLSNYAKEFDRQYGEQLRNRKLVY
jgi:hypothetical protein